MPKYGTKSMERLETCEEGIQHVFKQVIRFVDNTIIEGHRSIQRQQELYNTVLPNGQRLTHIDGVTQLGKHNYDPSKAVDALPWPIEMHGKSAWHDRARCSLFAGFVLGVARYEDVPMRWGGDWDGDWSSANHNFFDGPHFERLEKWQD